MHLFEGILCKTCDNDNPQHATKTSTEQTSPKDPAVLKMLRVVNSLRVVNFRSHSGTLALKTDDFSKTSVVLVRRKNGFTKTISLTENPGKTKEKSALVNPYSRFTKTTDVFTKSLGLKDRGS